MVTMCAPWYPAEEADELLPKWRDFMKTAPEDFSCSAAIWTVPPVPDFPEEYHMNVLSCLPVFTADLWKKV